MGRGKRVLRRRADKRIGQDEDRRKVRIDSDVTGVLADVSGLVGRGDHDVVCSDFRRNEASLDVHDNLVCRGHVVRGLEEGEEFGFCEVEDTGQSDEQVAIAAVPHRYDRRLGVADGYGELLGCAVARRVGHRNLDGVVSDVAGSPCLVGRESLAVDGVARVANRSAVRGPVVGDGDVFGDLGELEG